MSLKKQILDAKRMHLFVIACVMLIAGCTKADLRIAPPTSSLLDQPLNRVPLGAYWLEIFPDTQAHPSFFLFKKGERTIYQEATDPDEDISVVFVPAPVNTNEVVPSVDDIGKVDQGDTALVNLTGNGACDVVIERYKGNDTSEYSIFKLGDGVEKLANISNGFAHLRVDPADRAGVNHIRATDSHPNWGARSVTCDVILKWDGRDFVLDRVAMRKSAPTKETLQLLAQVIKEEFVRLPEDSGEVINAAPPELAEEILTLFYCGQNVRAHQFYNSCWPKGRSGKQAYWSLIMQEAKRSKYLSALAVSRQIY
jgi:hypothetical protein